ncbi:PH domain-containing protein DDB_G0267786-like [Actinia tenebrosa]|uniref:PH domain-containing protein DDB_G0267786-like n=1 Tax=Actinia tenebrosa TaxID=6105 RepID=A0A6P8IC33_ACTTE|nr:PH domain-containing protein DDB_G0267786-like [Actinia tenebrosa]
MGNIIPIDSHRKERIEDLAKDFLGTFSQEFIQAYGIEFAKAKLADIDKESFKEDGPKRELTYRKDKVEEDEPIKKGYLIKQGALVKNWKKRYFVVKQDYCIEYYENQEAFEKGFKAKGVICPAGYEVEEDADSAIIERLKKVAKQLGIDEKEIPMPEKYPEHTFELGHQSRRPFYITAENEEEKKKWLEVMKTCCRKFKGFKNPDLISRAAFKSAYRRTCYRHLYRHYSEDYGTEEQVMTASIVSEINNRVMGDVYHDLSTLPGGYKVRNKVKENVTKTLDSLVTAMVIPSYKGQVEATQKMVGPLDDLINSKKDEMVETQKKLTQKLSEELDDKLGVAFEDVRDAVIAMETELREIAKKMISPLREYLLVQIIDEIIKKAKTNDDIEASLKEYFKKLCTERSWRSKDYWYHYYNAACPMVKVMAKHEETFAGYYRHYTTVEIALDTMAEVLDAAGYTFQELFKELSKETDALKSGDTAAEVMVNVKDEVLTRFDSDAQNYASEISYQITHEAAVHYLTKTMEPVAKDLLSSLKTMIPDPINKVVSVQDRYEMYVDQVAKRLVKKAIGIDVSAATPEEKPKPAANDEAVEGSGKPAQEGKSDEQENAAGNVPPNDQPTTDL